MKSLKRVQTLFKVARILCLIFFILAIVAASGCLIAFIVLPSISGLPAGNGKTVADIIEQNAGPMYLIYANIATGLMFSGACIFLTKYSELFFREVEKIGTPFRHEVGKKMRKVGLVSIIVALSVSLLIVIVVASIIAANRGSGSADFSFGFSIFYGIFLLILSLFCDYGADLEEAKSQEDPNLIGPGDFE